MTVESLTYAFIFSSVCHIDTPIRWSWARYLVITTVVVLYGGQLNIQQFYTGAKSFLCEKSCPMRRHVPLSFVNFCLLKDTAVKFERPASRPSGMKHISNGFRGPEVIKRFSCSTQLSVTIKLLIKYCWYFNIYEQDKF